MMKIRFINQRTWPLFAVFISGSLLLGALAFEHIGGLAPCQMCYWQRHAHKAVLLLGMLALLLIWMKSNNTLLRLSLLLIGLAFIVSFGLAFWHMGVEYKWWEGPKSCAAQPHTEINLEDIQKALSGGIKLPSCSDVPWHLFGISMAGYNALISGISAVLSFTALAKKD